MEDPRGYEGRPDAPVGESVAPPDEKSAAGSFLRRAMDVFVAPGKAFAAVDLVPRTWWQPLLVLVLLTAGFVLFAYDRVIIPAQLEALAEREEMSGADLAQAESMIKSPAIRALGIGGAVLGTPLSALVIALVAHLVVGFLLGGGASFLRTFAVVCYGLLIGVLELGVKLPAMLAQGTPEVPFGPALLLGAEDAGGFLFAFLKHLDIFSLWKLLVMALGLSIVHRVRLKSVAVALIMVWLLYALGAATVGTALGG